MFRFQIEPWDAVKSVEITTLDASIKLKEEGDLIVYEFVEYGHLQFSEYKFKIVKRQNYREYLKDFIEVNVDMIDLKDLVGVMSYFREVYQHVVSLYRRGAAADLTFKWWDKDMFVTFSLYAVKDKEESEILSRMAIQYGDEHIMLLHGEKSAHVEEDLENHTKNAAGLYLLFKEYVLAQQEPDKT